MLNTTVQSVLEYKVGKYVFGCQNTPSTHTLLNMESYDYKLYCTCLFHAFCLFFGSRMHDLGMLNTTVQSVLEYKVGKYVFGCRNTLCTHISQHCNGSNQLCSSPSCAKGHKRE